MTPDGPPAGLRLPPPPPPPPLPPRPRKAPQELQPGQLLHFPYRPAGNTMRARVVAVDGPLAAVDLLITAGPTGQEQRAPPIRSVVPIAHLLSIWQVLPAGNLTTRATGGTAA